MNFFEFGPRQDFAGYWPESTEGQISDLRIPLDSRTKENVVAEYLGEPPRKPGKKGDFHKSAYGFFLSTSALVEVESACMGHLLVSPVRILGREGEAFRQVWVTNFVDCLDLARTSASVVSGHDSTKIGVIKRPVFDEGRWDGSELFVVPQDPSYGLFCSEEFVVRWKSAKLKGAMFTRFLMDPNPIRS